MGGLFSSRVGKHNYFTRMCTGKADPVQKPAASELVTIILQLNLRSTTCLALSQLNMSVATATFLFLAGLLAAEAFPGGAPSGACATLTPSHGPNSQSSTVPYSIDLTPFSDGAGGYQYTPGETYTSE